MCIVSQEPAGAVKVEQEKVQQEQVQQQQQTAKPAEEASRTPPVEETGESAEDFLAKKFEEAKTAAKQSVDKQEITPPVSDAKPVAPDELPADDPVRQFPIDRPQPDHWKRMREIHKADIQEKISLSEKLKQAQEELEKVRGHNSAVQQPNAGQNVQRQEPQLRYQPPPPQEERYSADWVLTQAAKSSLGELEADIKRDAEQYIASKMTPAELRDVFMKAKQGAFGQYSEEIANIAKEWTPVVLAGWQEREQQQQMLAQAQAIRQQSAQKVMQEIPDLNKPDSEAAKAFYGAYGELKQTFPNFDEIPNAPEVVYNYMDLRNKATKVSELSSKLTAVEKENAELKRRLGIVQQPTTLKGVASTASSEKPLSPDQELEQQFAAMGLTRK